MIPMLNFVVQLGMTSDYKQNRLLKPPGLCVATCLQMSFKKTILVIVFLVKVHIMNSVMSPTLIGVFLRDGTPNVGAYQEDAQYWIPGRQLSEATFPIPANQSEDVAIQVDLMFRQGRNAVSSEIYLGTSPDNLEKKITVEGAINIYSPTLLGETTYFWRVDTVLEDGSKISSDVWQFTTEPGAVVTLPPTPEPYTCVYGCDGTEMKTCKNKHRIRSVCYGGKKCDFETCQQHCDEEEECEFFFSNAPFKNNGRGGCQLYRSCEQKRPTHSS